MNSRQLKEILSWPNDPTSLDALQNDVEYHDMLNYLRHLRDDIQELRVKNQELHMQIARFDDLWFLFQKTRQGLRIETLERISGLKKRIALISRTGRNPETVPE